MSEANQNYRSVEEASAALLAMLARPRVHDRVRDTIAAALDAGAATRQLDAQLAELLRQIPEPPASQADLVSLARIAAFTADRSRLFHTAAARLVAAVLSESNQE